MYPALQGDEDPMLPPGVAPANAPVLLSDEALLADPITLQSKLLALELVLALLDTAGPAFRSEPRFIGAIKQYL